MRFQVFGVKGDHQKGPRDDQILIIVFGLRRIAVRTRFQSNRAPTRSVSGAQFWFIFIKLTAQNLCSVSIIKRGHLL